MEVSSLCTRSSITLNQLGEPLTDVENGTMYPKYHPKENRMAVFAQQQIKLGLLDFNFTVHRNITEDELKLNMNMLSQQDALRTS